MTGIPIQLPLHIDAERWSTFAALYEAQGTDPYTHLAQLCAADIDEILDDVTMPEGARQVPARHLALYRAHAVEALAEYLSAKDQVPMREAERRATDCLRVIAGDEGDLT